MPTNSIDFIKTSIQFNFAKTRLRSLIKIFDDERVYVDSEMREAGMRFKGKTWDELGIETLVVDADMLHLFSDKAIVAYLPAFLWWGMNVDDEWAYTVAHDTLLFILHDIENGNDVKKSPVIRLLTAEQRRVVSQWCEFLIEVDFDPATQRRALVSRLNEACL